MPLADAFVAELDMEAVTTRRVLERLPEAHLAWKPHGKSSSLGVPSVYGPTADENPFAGALDVALRDRRLPLSGRRIGPSIP